jgi:DNA-directed RNA polymerase subunit F|tara:strand:- start:160 stop:324 length:165 start_codon:yes stop_codon:yes gene_type:complete
MRLEEEAKKYMEKHNKTFPKRLEEIIENLKRIETIAEVTLKKLKELNAKNNSNT